MPKITETPRTQVTIGLDFEVLAKLREIAKKENTTVTKLIEKIIIKSLNKGGGNESKSRRQSKGSQNG